MTLLIDHPRLASFRRDGDAERVAAARSFLDAERLDFFRRHPDALYDRTTWSRFAALGLFSLFGPEDLGGHERGAFGVALLSDCLKADLLCSIDLAVYVQGIVATMTLALSPDSAPARALLPEVMTGRKIVCTAYTDADRSRPVTAEPRGDDLVIAGAKSLIINAVHADVALVSVMIGQAGAHCIVDLDSPGVTRHRLPRSNDQASFVQGHISFDDVVVPRRNLLARGIGRLWLWESVMTLSRLTNSASILRALGGLEEAARTHLAPRMVTGGLLGQTPGWALWQARITAQQAILRATIVDCILRLAARERVSGLVAGLKARAGTQASALAAQALDMAGGQGVLQDNPFNRYHTALQCKKFAAGGEYDLLRLFEAGSKRPAAREPLGAVAGAA
jgi:alkylation response protein AidB-like acyl-CoA dehydrogenase